MKKYLLQFKIGLTQIDLNEMFPMKSSEITKITEISTILKAHNFFFSFNT